MKLSAYLVHIVGKKFDAVSRQPSEEQAVNKPLGDD